MWILKLKTNYHNKTPIFLKDVDIEKVLVSDKIYFDGKNYILYYMYNDHKVKLISTYDAS